MSAAHRSPLATAALAAALLMIAPGRSQAQGVQFSALTFHPAVGPLTSTYVAEGGRMIPHLASTASLYLNYAHRPFRMVSTVDSQFDHDLVRYRVHADLLLGLGLFDRVEIGLAMPVTIAQETDGIAPLGYHPDQELGGGLGKMRLVIKARILTRKRLTLAVAAPLFLPTGFGEALLGGDGISFAPVVVGSFDTPRVSVALNAGYHFRDEVAFSAPGNLQQVTIDDAVLASLGARVRLWRQLEAIGDLFFAFNTNQQDPEEIPGEVITGLRYCFPHNVAANLGLGVGLTQGIGTPAFRVLAGVAYQKERMPEPPKPRPKPAPNPDRDGDGILNPDDNCPDEPEDKDSFEDEDGCPDPDNDRDTILDKDDKCPLEPEDKDGFEDQDGCPDLDNDQDGLPDLNDLCPLEPEDKDGFEDKDGCPDPDNDQDTILDKDDKCPLEPEVFNGVDDQDGCPDKSKGPVQVKVDKGRITTPPVYFATGKDRLLRRSLPTLRLVAEALQKNPWVKKVRIEGHTDSRGRDTYNLDLSQRRSDRVMQHLLEFGVSPDRLQAQGFGETQPIATNRTARGRAANRRVDFIIIDPALAPPATGSNSPD